MESRPKKLSARKLTILLLLEAPEANKKGIQPIMGTTRMQKLVFLVSEKTKLLIGDNNFLRFDFHYEAEKFGPADLDLYQDIDFLITMNLIAWDKGQIFEPTPEPIIATMINSTPAKTPALLPEEKEEDDLSFGYLMGVEPQELLLADAETEGERLYLITQRGIDLLNTLRSNSDGRQKELFEILEKACIEVRREYGSWSLKRLLKYVYDTYPLLTIKSTIREQIVGSK